MGVDFYEVYLELEEGFDIRFADDASNLPAETVGDLFDIVLVALRVQHPERFDADPRYAQVAWEKYLAILIGQLGLKREALQRPAHFVRDLKQY